MAGTNGNRIRRVMRLQPDVIRELPDERLIRIEINGCHAGSVPAITDAPEELALGWAMMHGFLGPGDTPACLTASADRVSIMVANGEDIDRRRLDAVGWVDAEPYSEPGLDPVMFSLSNDDLLTLIDRCWAAFRHDDGGDGYHQAAIASTGSVLCIARDRQVDLAVAKVLGWLFRAGGDTDAAVLLVRGMVGRLVVESAARMSLGLVITSGVPTAEACRAAQGAGLTLVGMATGTTVGVLVENGHLISE